MDMHHILYNFLKSDQQKNLTSFLPDPLLVPTILAGRPNIPRGCGLFHFPRFFVDPLSEPHAGAPAVLVDELDARFLKYLSYSRIARRGSLVPATN
jgi:hypothetical protein